MYKPMKQKFSTTNNIQYYPTSSLVFNGGLDLIDKEYKLSDNKTNKVKNLWFKDGELGIRWGQDYFSPDTGSIIYNAYKYKFMNKFVVHMGTKLYTIDSSGTVTQIYTSLTAVKGVFFKFNGKLYYQQNGNYIVWDGSTASAVVPYEPTVIINRTPTGGGSTNEQYNRLGSGFKNSFNGNGSATAYTLTDTNLDVKTVTATVGGGTKVEGTDFTVNRTTGIVTFTTPPATGTNNVIITAYKTVQSDIDTILKCLYAIPFGGQNDNRVFFAGNGTGYYYWTGITTAGVDPTYFPYNNYNIIGLTDENIYGFGKQYDTLVIFKARELYGVTYSFNGTTGVFNTFPINSQFGCDCPDTIQVINNNLVWLNSILGVCILVGTQVGSQRNAFAISRNINPWLLSESNLTLSTSVDFNGKYWLCVNDKVYLWDYFISPYMDTGNPDESAAFLSWWYFDNINAGCWLLDGQDLYYGHRTLGRLVKFHRAYDNEQFFDFGQMINAVYRFPVRMLGNGINEFSVLKAWVKVRGDVKTSYKVTYITSDDIYGDASTENIEVGSYSWEMFNWQTFTWGVMGIVYNWPLIPYEKNIRYFGIEFSNTDPGKDMNISGLELQYTIGKLIK